MGRAATWSGINPESWLVTNQAKISGLNGADDLNVFFRFGGTVRPIQEGYEKCGSGSRAARGSIAIVPVNRERKWHWSRHGYEVKTVEGGSRSASSPARTMRSGGSRSCFRTTMRSICTTPRRASCSTRRTRAFSHGCVRVEDPVRLAELVLDGETSGWTDKRIEAAFGDRERTVFLPRPLPIHIEYFTEFVDEFGELQERPDLYGLTRKVEGILAESKSRLKGRRYPAIAAIDRFLP